ncbi:MAG: sulfotransferase family 2 domain-containing protein [Luteolibacter sp.]
MLSIQKKFLFIHVPKTGGNSLQNILRDYSEDEIVISGKHQDGIERFEVRNKSFDVRKHSTLAHYRSVLDKQLFDGLFKFATIRNPWDMMVSSYFSPHRGITEWNRQQFKDHINKEKNLRKYICVPSSAGNFWKRVGLPFFQKPLLADIDFLIRFENIESDFKKVCEKLGIPVQNLPKRNASSRSHYADYYDDELHELVAKRFSEEIEFGKYEFEEKPAASTTES